jgi:hypothetical protein
MKSCIHFVGFRGEEYRSACRVWGVPNFIHPVNDPRSRREIHASDTVVYANGSESRPTEYNASDPDGLEEERKEDNKRYRRG